MITIDRVIVRCRSPAASDLAEATAARMARIADSMLPAALEARLESTEGHAGSLKVVIDFDPGHYDDHTVAILWADRIANEFARHLPPEPGGDVTTSKSGPQKSNLETPARTGSDPEDPPSVRSRLDGTESTGRSLEPDDSGNTARQNDPSEVRALISADERVAYLLQLLGSRSSASWDAIVAALPAETAALIDNLDMVSAARTLAMDQHLWQTCVEVLGRSAPGRATASSTSDHADQALIEDFPRDSTTTTHPTHQLLATRVGGIVLAYPWLSAGLKAVARELPDDDETARMLGLLELAGVTASADDPLLLELAGAKADLPFRKLQSDEAVFLSTWADEIYVKLSAVLPGFEQSSRSFVERELVVRSATLERLAGRIDLRLARRPLDILLDRYPFPLGSFRLPWTEPFTMRWDKG